MTESSDPKNEASKTLVPAEKPKSHSQMLAEYYQLSDAQRVFIETYLENGRKLLPAYKKAYPDRDPQSRMTPLGAKQLLKTPGIKKYLQYADKKAHVRLNKALERYAVSKERIVEELAKIAFSRPDDVQEWDADGVRIKPSSELSDEQLASIAEVKEQKTKDGKTVNIKQHDRTAALVQLGKEFGLFKNQMEVKAVVGARFIIEE